MFDLQQNSFIIVTPNWSIFINNHYLYTCTSITNCIFVGNLVTEIYFQQEVIVYVLCGNWVFIQPTAFGFVIPWEAFSRKYIPGADLYSPPSASSSCISLAPFPTPISSLYSFDWFTIRAYTKVNMNFNLINLHFLSFWKINISVTELDYPSPAHVICGHIFWKKDWKLDQPIRILCFIECKITSKKYFFHGKSV